MTQFRVTEVIDGDTIRISPFYQWVTQSGLEIKGDILRINGYVLPDTKTAISGNRYAKSKLENLLKGKFIILKNPQLINHPGYQTEGAKLACDVFLNDVDIANYFPEYRT